MTYGPAVKMQCGYCKKDYMCPNSRVHKTTACSITCANKIRRLARVEYTCVSCKEVFLAMPDHGAERKYCSRKCFLAECVQPVDKLCENCGGVFTAARSTTVTWGDGRRLYCSKKCYTEHSRSFEEKRCAWCGTLFYPISAAKDSTQMTCSPKCKGEFFCGTNSLNFKGGSHIHVQTNHKMVLIGKRKGFVGKYLSEHRLLIAKHIGRMLTRDEMVLHINNQGLDNRLSNLYVCESNSECAKRRLGSLPWPTKSNVDQLKERNT